MRRETFIFSGEMFFYELHSECLQFNELLIAVEQKSSTLFFMVDLVLLLVVLPTA